MESGGRNYSTSRAASEENIFDRPELLSSSDGRPLQAFHRTSSVPALDDMLNGAEMIPERSDGVGALRGISVQKARHRGYLMNSCGSALLLGPDELDACLPSRKISILIVTWNMNGRECDECLDELVLPESSGQVADVVVLGTQESPTDHRSLHVRVQSSLGASHLLLHAASLGCLQLCVFVRRPLVWHCSAVEHESCCIRPPAQVRTKGCVAVGFQVFGTSLLFVTCHLTAHLQRERQRIVDARRICATLALPRQLRPRAKSGDVTERYDNVFWFGDLNFRLALTSRPEVADLADGSPALSAENVSRLLAHDQLNEAKRRGRVFFGFDEGQIRFAPTYKYDPGTQRFDTSSKQRLPAYTDRILFKSCGRRSWVRCERYSSAPSYTSSDHKPVWGLFECGVRPTLQNVPLCAGRFDRSVFLDGLQRRARTMPAAAVRASASDAFRQERAACVVQ